MDRGLERYNPETDMMEIGGVGSAPLDLGVMQGEQGAVRAAAGRGGGPPSRRSCAPGTHHERSVRAHPADGQELSRATPSWWFRALNSFAFASRLEDGIPRAHTDLGNGIVPAPGNFTVTTLPLEFDRGYVESWNVMFQRQLRWSFIGEVGYVGTRQVDQLGYRELNWAPIGGGQAGRQLFRGVRARRPNAARGAGG